MNLEWHDNGLRNRLRIILQNGLRNRLRMVFIIVLENGLNYCLRISPNGLKFIFKTCLKTGCRSYEKKVSLNGLRP